nr:helix-turn-helix transcriptional regulator [Clostridia bacterium]
MSDTSYYELVRDYKTDDLISHCGYTVYPSHFHKRSEITYIVRGSCEFVINNRSGTAYADDIIFASAYYPHSYRTSTDVDRYTMLPEPGIDGDVIQVIGDLTFPCLLDDKQFNREYLLPLFEETYRAQTSKGLIEPAARWIMLKGYTDVIYGRFLERYGSLMVPRSKHINELINILNYIEENSAKRLTLDILADEFGYNRYYFSKFFNAYIGESLSNYISAVRIRKFVKLCELSPDENMLNLAMSVGFESMPSFYRSFRRVFRCTPTEYFKKS